MFDVGCGMSDVGCNVRFGMVDVRSVHRQLAAVVGVSRFLLVVHTLMNDRDHQQPGSNVGFGISDVGCNVRFAMVDVGSVHRKYAAVVGVSRFL
jgi:hypothetical protein